MRIRIQGSAHRSELTSADQQESYLTTVGDADKTLTVSRYRQRLLRIVDKNLVAPM